MQNLKKRILTTLKKCESHLEKEYNFIHVLADDSDSWSIMNEEGTDSIGSELEILKDSIYNCMEQIKSIKENYNLNK